MKKKHFILWILAGVATSLFMTQFSVMAADKVVVIPLFSSGDKIPTVRSKTGRVWMDRNLGAIRVAGSKTDSLAYGWLYQWGRPADGHESRTSPVTAVNDLSIDDVPGHGNFISVDTGLFNWLSPQNDALWEGESGTNNPCPPGFRLPFSAEWTAEMETWTPPGAQGGFESPLRITMPGVRTASVGDIVNQGASGYYWTSSETGTKADSAIISSSSAQIFNFSRAYGLSVRCIKN